MADASLAGDLEERLEAFGYELVELEQAGDARRPILRIRIDRPDSSPENPVTTTDCAKVSRHLEEFLDGRESLSDRYVLEVSSPGVERPLVRPRDFSRFAGQEIAVRGKSVLAGRGKQLEGVLVGIAGTGDEEMVVLKMPDGEDVSIPRSAIKRANLIFRWGGDSRPS